MPRQKQILGEMKARGITRAVVCDALKATYHERLSPQELSNILSGTRSETPKGQRVIGYVKTYLEKTK